MNTPHSRSTLLLIALFAVTAIKATGELAPSSPVIAINGASVIVSPSIVVKDDIFTVVGSALGNSYATRSSNNGTTWSSYVTGPGGATRPVFLSANTSGILATWANSGGQAYSSFSTNNGATWSTAVAIASNTNPPVNVCAVNNTFIATWQGTDSNAYAAISSDNGTTWSSPVTISNAGNISSAVIACSNSSGTIVATWRSSTSNAYAALSTNSGSTWSSPVAISATGNINSDTWCAANSTGFVASWRTSTNNAYSSSSANGTTWGTPVQIASSVTSSNPTQDVTVAATTNGFVAAFVKSDNNAYASFLVNEGSTWTTPVAVSSGGTVANLSSPVNPHPFIGIATNNNTCMFTWDGQDANVRTSYSVVTNQIDGIHNLSGNQVKNDFGIVYEHCNILTWQPSTASNLIGYSIYKDSQLVTNVSAQTMAFIDRNQSPNATSTYSVQSFDTYNNTSTLSSVQFDHGSVSTV